MRITVNVIYIRLSKSVSNDRSHLLAVQSNADIVNTDIRDNNFVIPLSANWDVQKVTNIQTGSHTTNHL